MEKRNVLSPRHRHYRWISHISDPSSTARILSSPSQFSSIPRSRSTDGPGSDSGTCTYNTRPLHEIIFLKSSLDLFSVSFALLTDTERLDPKCVRSRQFRPVAWPGGMRTPSRQMRNRHIAPRKQRHNIRRANGPKQAQKRNEYLYSNINEQPHKTDHLCQPIPITPCIPDPRQTSQRLDLPKPWD